MKKQCKTKRGRLRFKRKYKKISESKFIAENAFLGRYILELCKMKLTSMKLKKMRYTKFQKWLAINILVGATTHGYKFLAKMFPLPSISTLLRCLRNLKSNPGITAANAKMVRIKVHPTDIKDNQVFLLFDEMSVRSGVNFDRTSDSLVGFFDDGENRTSKLAKSSFCVMAVGIVRKWKYPLGFIFTDTVMKHDLITRVIQKSVKVMEDEGFNVLGFTTDQGSNFEKAFKMMGCTSDNPTVKFGEEHYFVYKDPPHLLKNARNFLERRNVHVPGVPGVASWNHIVTLHELDTKESLKLIPRVTHQHITGLKFSSRMKVKYAANVLSHSVASALNYLLDLGKLPSSASATSHYCQQINDIFDVLNSSSPRATNIFRRPYKTDGRSAIFLQEALDWLKLLKRNNSDRKQNFIDGFIQSINVVLLLSQKLKSMGIPYLSTRNLCQDPLELFFAKFGALTNFLLLMISFSVTVESVPLHWSKHLSLAIVKLNMNISRERSCSWMK